MNKKKHREKNWCWKVNMNKQFKTIFIIIKWNVNKFIHRGGSRRVAKFLSESNTFHIKSKAIKMLSCRNFATLLDLPLMHFALLREIKRKHFDFGSKNWIMKIWMQCNVLPASVLNFVFLNKFIFWKSSKRDPNDSVMHMYSMPSMNQN